MTCLIVTFSWELLQKIIKQVQPLPEDDDYLKYAFPEPTHPYFAFMHSITPWLTEIITRSKILQVEPACATTKNTKLANPSSRLQKQTQPPQNVQGAQPCCLYISDSASNAIVKARQAKNHLLCTRTRSHG